MVKVCDVTDAGQERSAHNEKIILQKLSSPHINSFVNFFEDKILNKTYLVLEHAGDQNLGEFVAEQRLRTGQPLNDALIRSVMS